MKQQQVFTPTEARQNFFQILKMATEGRNIIIRTKNALLRLNVEEIEEKSKLEKMRAVENLSKMNIPSLPIKEMKKIILTLHDIKLDS